MRIAIQGCAHGELDTIYETIQYIEKRDNKKIDLLLCCGDFQAVRNGEDLEALQCPPKYKSMNSFYRYYSRRIPTPTPTIFIGGNHEAPHHLWDLYLGGWAAPNIYYLGHSGVVKFGGYRIGGLSGIFNSGEYNRGYFERYDKPVLNMNEKRSVYHVRAYEIWKVLQLQNEVDIFLSHDWPAQVLEYGRKGGLYHIKPFFKEEGERGELGNPMTFEVLQKLKPSYWFAAHLHCKYAAVVPFDEQFTKTTKFLALDKCLPGRHFLQIIDVPDRGEKIFEYDLEWLSLLKATLPLMSFNHQPPPLSLTINHDEEWVKRRLLESNGSLQIPDNFLITAIPYAFPPNFQLEGPRNHQKLHLLKILDLEPNPRFLSISVTPPANQARPVVSHNPEEIPLDDMEESEATPPDEGSLQNPEEIPLDDEADEGDEGDEGAAQNPEEIPLEENDDTENPEEIPL